MQIRKITPFICYNPVSDLVFVKVETDEPDLFGWGECSLPARAQGVAGAVADLAGLIAGYDPERVEWIWQRMYRHGFWRGGPVQTSALSGIDMAIWDIRGKLANKSVAELLGGPVRDRIRAYVNLGLADEPLVFAERAQEALAHGFKAVKFYPLPNVALTDGVAAVRHVERCCAAVREVIGPDLDFAVDMHGRTGLGLAQQIESALRPLAPAWLEEPVIPESLSAFARLAARSETPLAVGERLFTRWGFQQVLEQGGAAIIQPDVANAGGISELVRIAAMAEMYGVSFAPHNPNGPVQAAASLNLAAYAQSFSMLETRYNDRDWTASLSSYVPTIDAEGYLPLPKGPGLGVEIDEDFLTSQTTGHWVPEAFRPDGSIGDW